MKICKVLGWGVLALCTLSCQRVEPERALVRQTISASVEDGAAPAVKTVLNPADLTKVLWSAHEGVNVFVGNTSYVFQGDNNSAAATANFNGEAPDPMGTYVMLTPYDGSAIKEGNNVTTTLASVQTGLANGFPDGTIILAGTSSTSSITCKHICSGLRFKVTNEDISCVVLRGCNDEMISGSFTFSFDGSGNPIAGAGTKKTVFLFPPYERTYFETGKWYYLAILPTTFSSGLILTAYSAEKGKGTRTITASTTFSRAKFKNVALLDDGMTWNPTGAGNEDLGYEDWL